MSAIAVIHTNLTHGVFGHPADLTQPLGGKPIIQHTLDRALKIEGIRGVVLLHPQDQAPLEALDIQNPSVPVTAQACALQDQATARLTSARKWCLTGWRGGLGGATIYDEALPPGPILQAMAYHGVASCVLLRADWCLFDPELASRQLARHLEAPEQLPLVFTQAAPGLSAVVCHHSALDQLAEHDAGFGQALGYHPKHAHGDPIGKDVCIAVPPEVRDAYQRFVFDTPESQARFAHIADTLGDRLPDADALDVVETANSLTAAPNPFAAARWATVELTPRRVLDGPITPQHHVPAILDRADMTPALITQTIERLATNPSLPVVFGGLGDALLHPQWSRAIQQAKQAGVLGIGIETDLVCDEAGVDALVASDLDVISVRLNADQPSVYTQVNGQPRYDQVLTNLQRLIEGLRKQNVATSGGCGTWVVPRLTKITENLADLESFYERWKTITGHAVIDRFATGIDADGQPLIPDQSPVNMSPPAPVKWPTNVLTVLGDGRITQHPQDWLALHTIGSVFEDAEAGV